MVSAVDSTGDVAGRMTVRKARSTFPTKSPRGLWMERVKKAEPSDFQQLAKEWYETFPEDERYKEYYPPNALNALRWMMGVWLVKDPDGFLKATSSKSFEHSHWAALAMVELMPEKAAEFLSGPIHDGLGEWFVRSLASELAKNRPELYLAINPDGLIDHSPGTFNHDWEVAISSLAKTDALAAGNACLHWKVENSPSAVYRAILAVAKAWKPSDPPISEWTGVIEDPRIRNFANHAWLSALAEKDPKAALKKLYEVKLKDDNDLRESAQRVILNKLATEYPVEALKLLKDMEGIFAKPNPGSNHDPFADEPSADEKTEIKVNPFSDMSPRIYSVADTVEDNGVRRAVLDAVADDLPDDPAALVAAIRQLSGEMSGRDPSWELGVEAYLIRLKSRHWSFDECMAAAGPWAAESNATPDDSTLQELASRAAKDPERALAALERFPEQARSFFAGEIIKQLPSSESVQRIDLLSQLPAEHWDRELGETLGRNAEDYAEIIASLPMEVDSDVPKSFTRQWGKQDPEATAEWLKSLPDDAVGLAATAGLASAWMRYDGDAATTWAASLPAGLARDAAADYISYWLSMEDSQESWHWADSIADPKTRAGAYRQVAKYWRRKVPEAFRAAHDEAQQDVGEPPYQEPKEDENNPFK